MYNEDEDYLLSHSLITDIIILLVSIVIILSIILSLR